MTRGRVPELDLLRFTAAVSVLLFHYAGLLTAGTPVDRAVQALGQFGFLGVPLFFMISGFVICWTASSKTPGDFALARVCRLYPSYWICILITSAVLALAGDPVSKGTIAANFTMVQTEAGFRNVDPVYWTLLVELKFYGLVLLLLLARQLPRVERWLTVWLLVTALSLGVPLWHGAHVSLLNALALDGDAAHFAFGCYAFLIYQRGASHSRWAGLCASAVLAIAVALRDQFHYTHSYSASTLVWVGLIVLGFQLALATLVARRWAVPASRLWYWLGSLTYPLYLLHAMAGKAFYRMLPAHWGEWARMGVTLAAVLAVTILLALAIEQRGCQALYAWLSGRKRRESADPRPSAPPGVTLATRVVSE